MHMSEWSFALSSSSLFPFLGHEYAQPVYYVYDYMLTFCLHLYYVLQLERSSEPICKQEPMELSDTMMPSQTQFTNTTKSACEGATSFTQNSKVQTDKNTAGELLSVWLFCHVLLSYIQVRFSNYPTNCVLQTNLWWWINRSINKEILSH